jgi:uncharacterized protein (TIGR02646 family)
MRKIERVALGDRIARGLRQYQAKVDASPKDGFNAQSFWNHRRRKSKTLLAVVAALKQMAGPHELCMYCVNSEAGDIEHFRPKTPYPEHMFRWENLLLCCSICGRKKGSQFPMADGQPLLIDPTSENPWDYLDFEPRTGNIMARIDPVSQARMPKGLTTILTFELNSRQAVSNGYKRTFRRLKTKVEELLQREFVDDDVERLRQEDDHGLLGWCFGKIGQKVQPFRRLYENKPQVWAICEQTFAINNGDSTD